MTDDKPSELDWTGLYEEGKHRRYSLLFAVNGGAFAIGKFFVENASALECRQLGRLTTTDLALGGALFTLLMTWDIFAFGWKMRSKVSGLFGPPGIIVLLLIGLLISTGWMVAGFPQAQRWILALCSLVLILTGCILARWWIDREKIMFR
jgi:hypothetical protein